MELRVNNIQKSKKHKSLEEILQTAKENNLNDENAIILYLLQESVLDKSKELLLFLLEKYLKYQEKKEQSIRGKAYKDGYTQGCADCGREIDW